MTNFTINFTYPWLLLLIIPAVALALIPYFRLAKRYRRTRNRVISVVLHLIIMVMCTTVLAGMTFSYEVPNTENELLIVVDASYSNNREADGTLVDEAKDTFIQDAIAAARSSCKVGIITFGFNQVYAAPLTLETENIYKQYMQAEEPDTTATNIAGALTYASSLFTNPKTSKIVLLSDGVQTDNDAMAVIKALVAEGIKVDTVNFANDAPNNQENKEVQIIGVETPDYNVIVGDACILTVTVQSSYKATMQITLKDTDATGNTTEVGPISIDVVEGIQTFEIEHSFTFPNMHQLYFEISEANDNVSENNSYYAYIFLETFDHILMVEKYAGEGTAFKSLLEQNGFTVTVANIEDVTTLPTTLMALREYDQVIMVNVANADMPMVMEPALDKEEEIHWSELLHAYVYEVGGGVFTVGGVRPNETNSYGDPVSNMYNREDLYGTLYQQMLPVQAINYTPPLGVMFILDRSGSMASNDASTGKTYMQLAIEATKASLYALTERDWAGIMTLENSYSEEAEMTPMPKMATLIAALDDIETGGGTVFTGAIQRAGQALAALTQVERKHIILISDGMPSDKIEEYGPVIEANLENSNITFSVVGIGISASAEVAMEAAVELGNGRFYNVPASKLADVMREELMGEEIKAAVYEEFIPTISNFSSPVVNGISQAEMPSLYGFFGTKAKDSADVILSGEYVPIYAQWNYGEGMVGSFMCDLAGKEWSGEFLASPAGQRFLINAINNLFPKHSIEGSEIAIDIVEDNYNNQMSIYATLEEGQSIRMKITNPAGETVEVPLSAANNYSRVTFTVTEPGIHTILLEKLAAKANPEDADVVLSSFTTQKVLSYSEEYNMFVEEGSGEELLKSIAEAGNGSVVKADEAYVVYDDFVKTLVKVYDPRTLFMILSLILFLLEVAVRKFKFKWPHEIIRDRKNKQKMFNQTNA